MKLITMNEAAARTGYSIGTLYTYTHALPRPRRMIGPTMLFAAREIDAWAKVHRATAARNNALAGAKRRRRAA